MLEVASSKIRMHGSASKALANARSCLWPAERFVPLSLTSELYLSGINEILANTASTALDFFHTHTGLAES